MPSWRGASRALSNIPGGRNRAGVQHMVTSFSSYYSGTDWLQARVAATPQALALLAGERRWTYGALEAAVAQTAVSLAACGVGRGDRVAALLPNSVAYVCLIHALARLGAVLVPLNTRLAVPELAWQLAHVGARWLVVDEKTAATARELQDEHGQILRVDDAGVVTAVADDPRPLATRQAPVAPARQAIVFTSGTSGRPKGVPLTFANHFYSAMASAYRLGVQVDDLWLSCLPLYHVGGLAVVFRSCLYGTAVDLHPRFDVQVTNHSLDTKPITLISLVPTMLYRLLESRTHWPPPLRLILLGGAAAPAELVQRANELPRPAAVRPPPIVAPTYGLTEASSQVATMLPREAARKPGSVGRPLLFTTVNIVDEAGQQQPPGTIGEVVVTGPTVMAGYFDRQAYRENGPQKEEGSFSSQPNTIHTGDMGYLDEEGDLWLVQRRSDIIVSGGENVYPAEVEQVLKRHPAVTAVCVVGIPDPQWGQRVAAMVVAGNHLTAAALEAFARQALAGYKIPRLIRFVEELPQTASGKVARKTVAAMLHKGVSDS